MFKISPKNQIAIFSIKINEIEMSKDYSDKDKQKITQIYKKKIRAINPAAKF